MSAETDSSSEPEPPDSSETGAAGAGDAHPPAGEVAEPETDDQPEDSVDGAGVESTEDTDVEEFDTPENPNDSDATEEPEEPDELEDASDPDDFERELRPSDPRWDATTPGGDGLRLASDEIVAMRSDVSAPSADTHAEEPRISVERVRSTDESRGPATVTTWENRGDPVPATSRWAADTPAHQSPSEQDDPSPPERRDDTGAEPQSSDGKDPGVTDIRERSVQANDGSAGGDGGGDGGGDNSRAEAGEVPKRGESDVPVRPWNDPENKLRAVVTKTPDGPEVRLESANDPAADRSKLRAHRGEEMREDPAKRSELKKTTASTLAADGDELADRITENVRATSATTESGRHHDTETRTRTGQEVTPPDETHVQADQVTQFVVTSVAVAAGVVELVKRHRERQDPDAKDSEPKDPDE
jgi:hypothetical protein